MFRRVIAFHPAPANLLLMERNEKTPADPELRRRIEELIAFKGGGHNEDLVTDIIENAIKILTDVEARGDVRVIQTAEIGRASCRERVSVLV